jgi:hypothetical protein
VLVFAGTHAFFEAKKENERANYLWSLQLLTPQEREEWVKLSKSASKWMDIAVLSGFLAIFALLCAVGVIK